ncbi:MAG: hypothetical protein K2W96_01810 [Gemmataceae bacterium]|nr:hypothetical protein [Gemmataceae bacterium]
MGNVIHALNNHLNSLLLQASCLQLKHKPLKEEVEPLRAEVKKAAALLRPLQTVRPWTKREKGDLDLVAVVRDVLATHPDEGLHLHVQWPDTPSQGRGAVGAVERLVLLMLRIGRRAASRATLAFQPQGLSLFLPGVAVVDGEEGRQELPPEADPGVPTLERLAAAWLSRQMGAVFAAEPHSEGAALVLRW